MSKFLSGSGGSQRSSTVLGTDIGSASATSTQFLAANGSSGSAFRSLTSADVSLTRTINTQTGTTYTFVLGDGSAAGGNPLITFGSSSATTVTVPPNSSVAFPVGTQIDCLQLGSGKVTLAQGSGVTINSKGTNKAISAQYVAVSLVKTATDTWVLVGDLIA